MKTKKSSLILYQIGIWIFAYYFLAIIIELHLFSWFDFFKFEAERRLVDTFVFNTLLGILVGTALGLADIFFLKIEKRKHTFRFLVLTKSGLYIITFITMIGVTTMIVVFPYWDAIVQASLQSSIFKLLSGLFLATFIYTLFVSVLISFIKEVNKKFGPGVLLPLFLGKYHNPREEERIFLFIDLKSSTTYAEKLGHLKYSSLIQDCFHDLNLVVAKYNAEIYQYIGDEVVVTWKIMNGNTDLDWLSFYFAFKKSIEDKTEYYKKTYGLVPEFKAGVNIGTATVTEVGDIKREIAYHGDVLNTAARIQGVCNQYGKKLLISEHLINRTELPSNFLKNHIGSVSLRGKEMPVTLFSVELDE